MPWHPPCALFRLILPAYSFFLRLPLSRLMEGASHCVYLGCIFAQSLALLSLDWILTFSSFRFIFPVQFSRCVCAPRPRPCRAAGFVPAVLWCPRHSALASLGRLLGLISTSWSFGFDSEGSSFLPILQNDTVFQSRFQSDPCPLGLNRFLCRFVVSVPLFLTSTPYSLN